MAGGIKYEHKSVRTVACTDDVVIARMSKRGWEHVGADHARLSTTLAFRRPKKRVSLRPVMVLVGIVAIGLVIAGISSFADRGYQLATADSTPSVTESSTGSPSEAPLPSGTPRPSASPTPAGPTVKVTCYTPDFNSSVDFVISRLRPDFTEAWAADIPTDPNTGEQHCDDGDANASGEGPKISPVNGVEAAIWKDAADGIDGRHRWTLTIPYYECVQHDSPEYVKTYPDSPNLATEAETMLRLCPDHPNAKAIQKRIAIQNGFAAQIGTETLTDGDWLIGAERVAGTYRAESAGGTLTCYWSRKSASGTVLQSVWAFGPLDEARTVKVTLSAGEKFQTKNCGVWFRLTP